MPVNKKRNVAIALGLGFSSNSIRQNLKITELAGQTTYSIVENGSFNKNKFTYYTVEMPLEFRWRTSTAETYNFWRIYTGFKLGYVLATSAKYESDSENYKINNLDNFNRLQYGLTLSVGYDTWNAHLYYGLNSLFEDSAQIDGSSIDINVIEIGLMFYIL